VVKTGVYNLVYTNCGLFFWALGGLEDWRRDIRFGGVLLGVMSGSNYLRLIGIMMILSSEKLRARGRSRNLCPHFNSMHN